VSDPKEKQTTDDSVSQDEWMAAVEASPFARCATCKNAGKIELEQGTLLCGRFNMHINAEADEIPDDCPEYEHDPNKPVPVDVSEQPMEAAPEPETPKQDDEA